MYSFPTLVYKCLWLHSVLPLLCNSQIWQKGMWHYEQRKDSRKCVHKPKTRRIIVHLDTIGPLGVYIAYPAVDGYEVIQVAHGW